MRNFKSIFIEALTSNKYNQTTETLYDKGRFDALGLACFIAGVKTDDFEALSENERCCLPGDSEQLMKTLRYNLVLPQSLKDASQGGVADEIAILNDYKGASFHDIAEWIKLNLDEDMNFIAQQNKIAA